MYSEACKIGGPLEKHGVGLFNLAVAQVTLGNEEGAKMTLLRVVEADSTQWKAMSMLANYDIQEEKWESAKKYLEEAR